MIFRRSIYIAKNVNKGDVLDKTNLRIIRPGFGIEPKFYEQLIGIRVNQDIKTGTPFNWKFVLKSDKN